MNIKNVKFASQIIDKSRAFHLVPTYLQEKFVLQNVETLSGWAEGMLHLSEAACARNK